MNGVIIPFDLSRRVISNGVKFVNRREVVTIVWEAHDP